MDVKTRQVGAAQVSAVGLESELVFAFAHPSTSYLDTFLTETLVWHGAGVVGVDGRYVGEGDGDLSYERAAQDIAEALEAVVPPGKKLVLVGHSGGASLMALVQVRFRVGAAMVFLAPHPSRAHLFEQWIDPSRGQASVQPELDIYHPERSFPLDEAFVRDYRAAQRARVQKIAAEAATHLREGRGEAKLRIAGMFADPRFVDRSLDPNQRSGAPPFGDPAEVNQRAGFFADGCTARSFFDQFYLPTTSANLLTLAPWVGVPCLSVAFGADPIVFPSQTLSVATALPRGSTVWTLENAVHNPRNQKDHLDALAWKILAWIPD